jgi:hypothetical protein
MFIIVYQQPLDGAANPSNKHHVSCQSKPFLQFPLPQPSQPIQAVAKIELLGARTLSNICANPFPTSGLVALQALKAPG